MRLLDNIKNGISEKKEKQKKEEERQKEIQLKTQECSKDRSMLIQTTFGHSELGL